MSRRYMACSRHMSIGVANKKKLGNAHGPCTWHKFVGLIARKLSSYLVMDGNEPVYYIYNSCQKYMYMYNSYKTLNVFGMHEMDGRMHPN
jgi:hypothetical protein